jgi:hypothetical protein
MTVTVRARREFPVSQNDGQGTRTVEVGEEIEVSKTRAQSWKDLGKVTIVGASRKKAEADEEEETLKPKKTRGRRKAVRTETEEVQTANEEE